MASLNKVLLMGNLTRQPELRYTPNGQAVCDLGLAVNRRYIVNGQERDEVCFIDIVVWAKQAESCGRYLQKGSPVFIEGRLHNDNWEDKDGNRRSRMRVTAERVQFLSSRSSDESRYNQGSDYQSRPRQTSSNNNYSNTARNSAGNYNNESAPAQEDSGNNMQMPPPPKVFDNDIEAEDDIPF